MDDQRHQRYAGPGSGQERYQRGEPGRAGAYTSPRGYTRTDERIRDDLCERLAYAGRINIRDVEVNVAAGVVHLSGTVQDRGQKYDIEEIAEAVFGVRDVENHIRVARPGPAFSGGTQRGLAGQLGPAGESASQTLTGSEHVSGISSSGAATGSSASSYGGGLEKGHGGSAGGGPDTYGGTTSPGRSAPDATKP